jgi:hypothetical protein
MVERDDGLFVPPEFYRERTWLFYVFVGTAEVSARRERE